MKRKITILDNNNCVIKENVIIEVIYNANVAIDHLAINTESQRMILRTKKYKDINLLPYINYKLIDDEDIIDIKITKVIKIGKHRMYEFRFLY